VLGVTAFAAAVPTPLYPLYEQTYHFGAAELGLIFAAYTPGVFLTLFVIAPQAERIGRRRLLYLGMGLTGLGSVVFAFADGPVWLAVGRVISGLAVGSVTSVATAAMSDLEPFRDHHHVARVAVAANFGAFALGVLVSGWVTEYVGDAVRLVYVVPLAASVLGTFAVWATPESAPPSEPSARIGIQRISVPTAIRRPFWVAVGGIAACYSIYGLFAALVPSYLRESAHLANRFEAGGVVALMFGLAAIVQLGTSQIRDRRALLIGFPLLVGSLVALVLVLRLGSWPFLFLVDGALGTAVGLAYMGSVTLVDRVAPELLRDEILAGFYLAGYLALAVPTIGVAEVSESIGLSGAGALFGMTLAVGAVVLLIATWGTPTPPGGGGRARGPAADD